ncbi:MAG: hypothetical protein CMA65_04990 [Euryarchaeota archaeon]|nr:hypothetical protein [Euryarchaeota archaeon]
MGGLICDLGVAARVVTDNRVLLVQEARGKYSGCWGLPKGYVDEGESPEQAVLRELREETNLDGSVIGLAAVRTALRKDCPAIFLCYDVSAAPSALLRKSEEISAAGWYTLSEVGQLDWVSETMQQLAIEGLRHRKTMKPSHSLTTRQTPYAVYSTSHKGGLQ